MKQTANVYVLSFIMIVEQVYNGIMRTVNACQLHVIWLKLIVQILVKTTPLFQQIVNVFVCNKNVHKITFGTKKTASAIVI